MGRSGPLVTTFAIFVIATIAALSVRAAQYRDPVYGFSISYPDDWTATAESDGEDRVFRLTMPDGGATAEVRAVRLRQGVTATALRETFGQAAIPQGALVGAKPDTFNGLQGEVAAWRLSVEGGEIVVGGFFTANAPVGYALVTVTSAQEFDRRSPVLDGVLNTFKPGDKVTAYVGAPVPAHDKAAAEVDPRDGQRLLDDIVAARHPELGFVLYHYRNWAVDQPEAYSVRAGPADVPPRQRPSITIESIAGSAYVSLEAAAVDLKQQLSDMPGVAFDGDGPQVVTNIAIDGKPLPGWSFGASYHVNGVQFRQLSFMFKRDVPDVYHFIYVTGPATAVAARKPEMMRMLQTIELVPFVRR